MRSKISYLLLITSILITSCTSNQPAANLENIKQEIFKTEKNFESAAEKAGVSHAFAEFADDSAVIVRDNGILYKGKEKIRKFYEAKVKNKKVLVKWTPDFIEVSPDGTLGYTYGKFSWSITDSTGKEEKYGGIFHTVWKKQKNGSWKYVWD